jgi:hypothetical protein
MIVAFVSGTTGMISRLGKGFPCAENILGWRYQQFSCDCARKFCLQVQRVQRPPYRTESSADLRNCWVPIVRNNIYLRPLFNVQKTHINHLKMPGLGCEGFLYADRRVQQMFRLQTLVACDRPLHKSFFSLLKLNCYSQATSFCNLNMCDILLSAYRRPSQPDSGIAKWFMVVFWTLNRGRK